MNDIFQDSMKIKIFALIQERLIVLDPNSTEEDIDIFLNQIPKNYLNQKDDLMTICQLIAYSIRNIVQPRKNIIKIFDRLMKKIKIYLFDEKNFLWNIFGGHFYFKLLMYEEGILTIDDIVYHTQEDSSYYTAEYFSPEIFNEAPEIYDKEIKYILRKPLAKRDIEKFKEKRSKHIQWLRQSSDYNDPLYREIEEDPLRLAIKIDDIDTFQKVVSNQNLSLNSTKINENVFDNFNRIYSESKILDYTIRHGSIKIFKFLVMNDVDFYDGIIVDAFSCNNYDIFHITERIQKEIFAKYSLIHAIKYWRNEFIDYSFENYNFDFLEKSDVDSEYDDEIVDLISNTTYSMNFMFFESKILPFLRKNHRFVNDNINKIIIGTYYDWSCFFMREFMKWPTMDINHVFESDNNTTMFSQSILYYNLKAAEIVSSHPKFVLKNPCYKSFSALQMVSKMKVDPKFIEIICKQPNIDVNWADTRFGISAIQLALTNGNIHSTQYLIDHFPALQLDASEALFFYCLKTNHLMTLKIHVKYCIDRNIGGNCEEIISKIKEVFSSEPDYREEQDDTFRKIYREVLIEKPRPPPFSPENSIRIKTKKPKKTTPTIFRPKIKIRKNI